MANESDKESTEFDAELQQEIDAGISFIVDKILDRKKDIHGRLLYKVRWEGYGPEDDTWEPECNLTNCPEIVAAFNEEKREKQRQSQANRRRVSGYEYATAPPPTVDGGFWMDLDRGLIKFDTTGEESIINSVKKRKKTRKSLDEKQLFAQTFDKRSDLFQANSDSEETAGSSDKATIQQEHRPASQLKIKRKITDVSFDSSDDSSASEENNPKTLKPINLPKKLSGGLKIRKISGSDNSGVFRTDKKKFGEKVRPKTPKTNEKSENDQNFGKSHEKTDQKDQKLLNDQKTEKPQEKLVQKDQKISKPVSVDLFTPKEVDINGQKVPSLIVKKKKKKRETISSEVSVVKNVKKSEKMSLIEKEKLKLEKEMKSKCLLGKTFQIVKYGPNSDSDLLSGVTIDIIDNNNYPLVQSAASFGSTKSSVSLKSDSSDKIELLEASIKEEMHKKQRWSKQMLKTVMSTYITFDQAVKRSLIPCNYEMTQAELNLIRDKLAYAIKKQDSETFCNILDQYNPMDLRINELFKDNQNLLTLCCNVRCDNEKHEVCFMINTLLSCHVNVNQVLPNGQTALFHAIKHASVCQIEQLLAASAKIDIVDSMGNTPLITALQPETERISERAVKVLLDHGANFTARNSTGKTVLDLANGLNKANIVLMIENHVKKLVWKFLP